MKDAKAFILLSSSADKPDSDRPMRVLIVEDEAKMAGLIRRGLEREGIAVDVAATARTRCGWAEATEYDAIVLDLMLPGIDGSRCAGGCAKRVSGPRS